MNTSTAHVVAPHAFRPPAETLTLSLKKDEDISITLSFHEDFYRNPPGKKELMLTRKMLDAIFTNMPLDCFEE